MSENNNNLENDDKTMDSLADLGIAIATAANRPTGNADNDTPVVPVKPTRAKKQSKVGKLTNELVKPLTVKDERQLRMILMAFGGSAEEIAMMTDSEVAKEAGNKYSEIKIPAGKIIIETKLLLENGKFLP